MELVIYTPNKLLSDKIVWFCRTFVSGKLIFVKLYFGNINSSHNGLDWIRLDRIRWGCGDV